VRRLALVTGVGMLALGCAQATARPAGRSAVASGTAPGDAEVAQAGSNIDRFAGSWSHTYGNGESTTESRTHVRFEAQGRDILVIRVADEDWAPGLVLKGQESAIYRLQLTGRRVSGRVLWQGKNNPTLQGIVNEEFNQINLQWTNSDMECFSSREEAASGRKGTPCGYSTLLRRRNAGDVSQ